MATTDIATSEEIDRRIEADDTARRLKRSAAAKQVGELATTRAELATQLDEVERQLGEVLADASDVLDIDELARFTNIPAADLTGWLTAHKPSRTNKKKKPSVTAPSTTTRRPSTVKAPTNGQASATPETAVPRTDTVATPERVTAGVT
ncbi:hypothetical protein ALI144C_52445 [Actinosynnema sp. ALI-1.44]|uniref:hypothetical protein n=1 Tax=Actinosynnema sp. ALI-1.44 TaxID=1933779 RepID=UPI00097BEE6D|nr:hypothetical protein [Actinosynnema sp. ALI-1.44]ONI71144.1 hypothetical protein ALI144C_52445 [Actinosynnema sp. ALI-1.44]